MKKYNIIVSLASIAIGLLILFLSRDFLQFDSHGNPGEGFWPRLLAALFVGLGTLLGLIAIFSKKDGNRSVDFSSTPVRKAYIACGISALYGILLIAVGFLIATPVFVPSIMILMGERRPKIVATTAIGITAAIWLIFMVVFKSPLPESIFLG